MKTWDYEIGDVLIIIHKDIEQVARIADFVDSLDNTTPLYVNLRVSDGLRWGARRVQITSKQIICADPGWYDRQKEQFDASIKEAADAAYAKMTPAERARLEEQTKRRARRSSLDIMIDRACGIES